MLSVATVQHVLYCSYRYHRRQMFSVVEYPMLSQETSWWSCKVGHPSHLRYFIHYSLPKPIKFNSQTLDSIHMLLLPYVELWVNFLTQDYDYHSIRSFQVVQVTLPTVGSRGKLSSSSGRVWKENKSSQHRQIAQLFIHDIIDAIVKAPVEPLVESARCFAIHWINRTIATHTCWGRRGVVCHNPRSRAIHVRKRRETMTDSRTVFLHRAHVRFLITN